MPWADQVSAILEAWFAGSRGAEAVANIIFGDVNPSAKLPITFPKSEADLPHPTVVKPPKATSGRRQKAGDKSRRACRHFRSPTTKE